MSTTHAGGIQPSASFFRPSKPSQYSPPGTPDIPLGPLPHDEGSVHESEPDTQFVSLKRVKQSREPLLPGPGPHSASSRHSMLRDPPLSPTRLMRNSVDRVLTISRGLSFDSVTKSGLRENKLADEESQQHHHRKRYHNPRDSGRSSVSLVPPSIASLSASSASPEPHPLSFIPTPPLRDPPLSAVPLIDHLKNRPYRRWERHPSRNRFFFNGRILTGGDSPWAFVASFALVLAIAGCWFSTAGVWWWLHVNPAVPIVAAYLTLLTLSTMLTTVGHCRPFCFVNLFYREYLQATTDPGILPRNLDPDPPYAATSPSDGADRLPMPRDLKVRSDV
jgi:palmitoyltransferase ZDHHC9/14/18